MRAGEVSCYIEDAARGSLPHLQQAAVRGSASQHEAGVARQSRMFVAAIMFTLMLFCLTIPRTSPPSVTYNAISSSPYVVMLRCCYP